MKKQTIDKIIHGTQIVALAMFGLAIYNPTTLEFLNIVNVSNVNHVFQVSFWGLAISLAYEHFLFGKK